MLPEQSVQAALDLRARLTLPVHWAKFNLAFHPWKEPIERFTKEAIIKELYYATPRIGEYVNLAGQIPKPEWWKSETA